MPACAVRCKLITQAVLLKGMLPYRNKQKRKVRNLEGLADGSGLELTSIPADRADVSPSQLVCMHFSHVQRHLHIRVHAHMQAKILQDQEGAD